MLNIDALVEAKVDEVLEYLDEAPVVMDPAIAHDVLYDLCREKVIDDLAANAE
jgi:hypothetical protein